MPSQHTTDDNYYHYHSPALWPWESCLTSLGFSFFICKLHRLLWPWKEVTGLKQLAWGNSSAKFSFLSLAPFLNPFPFPRTHIWDLPCDNVQPPKEGTEDIARALADPRSPQAHLSPKLTYPVPDHSHLGTCSLLTSCHLASISKQEDTSTWRSDNSSHETKPEEKALKSKMMIKARRVVFSVFHRRKKAGCWVPWEQGRQIPQAFVHMTRAGKPVATSSGSENVWEQGPQPAGVTQAWGRN